MLITFHIKLPLRGFLNCPRCGKKLQGSGSTGGSGLKHYYYHCQNGCKERMKACPVNVAFSDYLTTFKFKKTVQEMYEQVLQDVFKNKNAHTASDKKTQQEEFEKNKKRLDNARKMMLDGEMDRAEYIEIKNLIEPKINEMLNQETGATQLQIELRGYLKNGLNAVQNLGYLFDRADIEGKHMIIRSILKENVVFSNGKTRTGKLNHLIELITYADGQHKGDKKKNESKFCSHSGKVAGTGLEPMTFGL
jgi:site-specific DNA recombinase